MRDRHRRVIFLGPPGSGKGTAAQWLSEVLGVPHVSTGAMFRETVRQGGALGQSLKQFLDKGLLVPDEIAVQIVQHWLDDQGADCGFILDGFPRTLPQAEALDRLLAERHVPVTIAILLEVSEAEIIERVLGRLSCEKCGALYHATHIPPKREGICDNCGGRLVRRGDDTEQTVRDRLRVYEQQTKDVVKHYERTGVLRRVSGTRMKETAFANILPLFKS